MISFRAIEMRDIRHRLSKYPLLGRNECPARFFRIGHLLHFTMQRCSPIEPNHNTVCQTGLRFLPPRPESPLGTTVAQAELQLSAPVEQAGRCGPGTG